jgi:hypothetical protein
MVARSRRIDFYSIKPEKEMIPGGGILASAECG